MTDILFCNISYLPYYDTNRDSIVPQNGGAYVTKMKDAGEKHNFEECDDGQYRGFVETKHHGGYEAGIAMNTYNSLHIENISSSAKNKDYIDNVLVVFCAKHGNRPHAIVGWYKNATVFRYRPLYKGRFYNIQASKRDCHLLPEEERSFYVPRAKRDGFGFGQSNVWYATAPKCNEYVNKVIRYIESYAL